MEVHGRVRRAVQVEGMSVRQAAREFGLSRKTIGKMLEFSAPPGYQRKKPVARPKLGPWLAVIDQILEDDEAKPKKQRLSLSEIGSAPIWRECQPKLMQGCEGLRCSSPNRGGKIIRGHAGWKDGVGRRTDRPLLI